MSAAIDIRDQVPLPQGHAVDVVDDRVILDNGEGTEGEDPRAEGLHSEEVAGVDCEREEAVEEGSSDEESIVRGAVEVDVDIGVSVEGDNSFGGGTKVADPDSSAVINEASLRAVCLLDAGAKSVDGVDDVLLNIAPGIKYTALIVEGPDDDSVNN